MRMQHSRLSFQVRAFDSRYLFPCIPWLHKRKHLRGTLPSTGDHPFDEASVPVAPIFWTVSAVVVVFGRLPHLDAPMPNKELTYCLSSNPPVCIFMKFLK